MRAERLLFVVVGVATALVAAFAGCDGAAGGKAPAAPPTGDSDGSATAAGGGRGGGARPDGDVSGSSGGGAAGSAAGNAGQPETGAPSGDMTDAEGDATRSDEAGSRDASLAGDGSSGPTIVKSLDITEVWSGHPVGFALLTRGDSQFAVFYDAARAMTIARRSLTSDTWDLVRLPTSVEWDSHNYVTMAIDDDGYIHVAGNMHSVPLIYFRTIQPLDIHSFARVPSMVGPADASFAGPNEASCTYPQFFRGPTGALIFAYRDGVSGNGNYVFNTYDLTTRSWSRLLASPLLDGEGARNAYPVGPLRGPDGFFHLVWVWRETPDASTNHDLSYARTTNLTAWETATGRALTLPVTLATGDIVDPVPVNGGMINNNTKVGFDSQNRPIVAYHKFDANGNTQIYNARLENGRWVTHQTSNWNYRWAFSGTGTLVFQIELDGVKVQPDGSLTQTWYHAQYGGWGAFRVNESTLQAEATIPPPLPYPPSLDQPISATPGMIVRWSSETGQSPDGITYLLRWETLASNQDMPRATIPPPTRLRLYGFR